MTNKIFAYLLCSSMTLICTTAFALVTPVPECVNNQWRAMSGFILGKNQSLSCSPDNKIVPNKVSGYYFENGPFSFLSYEFPLQKGGSVSLVLERTVRIKNQSGKILGKWFDTGEGDYFCPVSWYTSLSNCPYYL